MSRIIVYGSEYGTAKKYADELSRRTGIEAVSFKDAGSLSDHGTVIYIGAIYAGGVLGLAKTVKKLGVSKIDKLLIATVGVTDPGDAEYMSSVDNAVAKKLPPEIMKKTRIFHLRGGIDYTSLSFKHRTLLKMLYKRAVKLPEEQKTADIKAIIETYDKTVDYTDFSALDMLTAEI